jgi:hypothetical protein
MMRLYTVTKAIYIPPMPVLRAWRNVKFRRRRGKKRFGTNRGLFHAQNCNFPEDGLIFKILCSFT